MIVLVRGLSESEAYLQQVKRMDQTHQSPFTPSTDPLHPLPQAIRHYLWRRKCRRLVQAVSRIRRAVVGSDLFYLKRVLREVESGRSLGPSTNILVQEVHGGARDGVRASAAIRQQLWGPCMKYHSTLVECPG